MKTLKISLVTILLFIGWSAEAQQNVITPDLSTIKKSDSWVLHNRKMTIDEAVHLNGQQFDGLLYNKDLIFKNGKIDLDIKGKDEPGRSFVGLAFHGLNDSTFDAIYFRPFNFKNPDRNGHSVQYISHPEYPWYRLRQDTPEKYENPVDPVPDPNDWFHATIIVDYPAVTVYVNNAEQPSLVIEQISKREEGWIGFWVGNGSEGWFKNLIITNE